MTKVYIQAIILMIVAILIIILAGCSTTTDKKLNLIGKELEKLNQQIQVGNILLIQEVNKTNKLLKKNPKNAMNG